MECSLQFGWLEFGALRDLAQTAEGLGYRTIYFPDHLVAEGPERQAMGVPAYDPFMQAAVVAGATSRVQIGHMVLCNLFRHPAVTARSLSTLDHMSNGRMVAGLGTGWTETEFRMTGIPFPEIGERLRMLDEALTCIRGLWGPEPFTFEGEFYRFREANLTPRPLQKSPRIVLGGNGKGLLRIAARHADLVNLISGTGKAGYIQFAGVKKFTAEAFREKVAFLHDEARKAGRDPKAVGISGIAFTVQLVDSREHARAIAEGVAGMFGTTPELALQSPLFLVGTPEDCIGEIKRRQRDWGLTEMILATTDAQLIERVGREVLPHI